MRAGSSIRGSRNRVPQSGILTLAGISQGLILRDGSSIRGTRNKQGSLIREPYLSRIEPGADIEGWFLNQRWQNEGETHGKADKQGRQHNLQNRMIMLSEFGKCK